MKNTPMKRFFHFTLALLALAILLGSCSHQSDVVSNGLLQKRKYRKGFHMDRFGHDRYAITQKNLPEKEIVTEGFSPEAEEENREATAQAIEPDVPAKKGIIGLSDAGKHNKPRWRATHKNVLQPGGEKT